MVGKVVALAFAVVASQAVADDPTARKAPALTLTSLKSADALQDCIGLALEPVGKPRASRDGDRRVITIGPVSLPTIEVTIIDAEPRTIEARAFLILNHKWRERIRFCAA